MKQSSLLAHLIVTGLLVMGMVRPAVAQDAKSKQGTLTVEECTAFRERWRPDSSLKGLRFPEATQKLSLPLAPRDDVGKEIELKLLINALGGVDSVRARGMMSSTYEERLQVAMKRFRFKPATWQGCAVPFWLTLQVTP